MNHLTNSKRLEIAYSNLVLAQVKLNTNPLTLTKVRETLDRVRTAACALQAMECSLAGNPEPRSGE